MNSIQNTLINKTSIIWTSLLIFTLTSIPSTAQTIHTIRDILKKTTVQINTDANPGGSGVIIQKEGNTYSVLTAKHVVCEYEIRDRCSNDLNELTIRTHDSREYPIKKRQILQTKEVQHLDLAIVTFNSPEHYEVAELGNSDKITQGSDIFVAGFNWKGHIRWFTVIDGIIVNFTNFTNNSQISSLGYRLVYKAKTVLGTSGAPVFDKNGKVIGIHGLAETTEDPETNVHIKTGFSAGIPINILYRILPHFNKTP